MIKVPPFGPRDAKIAIVGEAPGADEVAKGKPFMGASGWLLDEVLSSVGLDRSQIYLTNIYKSRPEKNDITSVFAPYKKRITAPSEPFAGGWATADFIQDARSTINELRAIQPNVVVALGNTPLRVLCGKDSITKWRGSELESPTLGGLKVIPTYHPAAVLRMADWRWILEADMARVKRESEYPEVRTKPYHFIIQPSFQQAWSTLEVIEGRLDSGESLRLSVDLETRHGKIACVGISWSDIEAICIPILAIGVRGGYWHDEQLFSLIQKLRSILLHPNAYIVGQNFLYDAQYFAKWFGFAPIAKHDTMIGFHTCFLRSPKALDFIASLTNEHYRYWKDDGKTWDPKTTSEKQLWYYNCEDCVRTWEASVQVEKMATSFGIEAPFKFQQELFEPVLFMMLRGIPLVPDRRAELIKELKAAIEARRERIEFLSGRKLNPDSPKQLQEYFYKNLGIMPVKSRKTGGFTTDEEALKVVAKREPLVGRLVTLINEFRQLRHSLSVCETEADPDGHLRCSYNIAGTATTRWASRENAFGTGTNLQNWTKGVRAEDSATGLSLPNLRSLLAPPPGEVIVEADLDRADLQVVVWEADDQGLKDALRHGVDIHALNAITLFNLRCEIEQVKKKFPKQRQIAKMWVHGTNYGGSPRTMAGHAGITVAESETLQKRWFQLHPGIKDWHHRTLSYLRSRRYVENAFGYKCFFFNNSDELLKEALAWIPQSTVARTINFAVKNLHDLASHLVTLRLQTHDSVTFTTPAKGHIQTLRTVRPLMLTTIPYPDPLVIPIGFSVSSVSWGDVKEVDLDHGD